MTANTDIASAASDAVEETLGAVIDPEQHVNIVDLGLAYGTVAAGPIIELLGDGVEGGRARP